MKVRITGVTGVIGRHLAEHALKQEAEVHGLRRQTSRIEGLPDGLQFHYWELRDAVSIARIILKVRPDRIFHLAAQSHVPTSFDAPGDTFMTNIFGTTNLLNAVLLTRDVHVDYKDYSPRIMISSSSEVYGTPEKPDEPMQETLPFRPPNPYAVSKVGEEMVALQYYLQHKVHTVRVRFFTQTGPGRDERFVEGSFAAQIARIVADGKNEGEIKVGKLAPSRTWCDVRDGVQACWKLLKVAEPGEVFNLAGDEEATIRDVLTKLQSFAGVSVHTVECSDLVRPVDIPRQRADTSKLKKVLNWKPEISLDTTLQDLLNYHRNPNVETRISPDDDRG